MPWLGAWPARCTNRVPSAFPTPIPRSRVPRPPVAHLTTSQERRREGRERGATGALEQRAGVVVSPYLARAYGIPASPPPLRTCRCQCSVCSRPFASSVPSTAQLLLGPAFRLVSQQLAPPSCKPMQGLVRHGHPHLQYYLSCSARPRYPQMSALKSLMPRLRLVPPGVHYEKGTAHDVLAHVSGHRRSSEKTWGRGCFLHSAIHARS